MNPTIEMPPIDTSEAVEAEREANLIMTNAGNLSIVDQAGYNQAGDFLKTVKVKYAQLDTMRKNMTRPLDSVKRQIMDLFRKPLEYLAQAEQSVKRTMIVYVNEQEKIRREQERKLQQEADRKRQDALRKAEAARAKGQDAKAEKFENKADSVALAPTLAPRVEQVNGISKRKIWKFQIVDGTKIPREFLCVDEKKLGDFARTMEGSVPVPGVRFYFEETIAARK